MAFVSFDSAESIAIGTNGFADDGSGSNEANLVDNNTGTAASAEIRAGMACYKAIIDLGFPVANLDNSNLSIRVFDGSIMTAAGLCVMHPYIDGNSVHASVSQTTVINDNGAYDTFLMNSAWVDELVDVGTDQIAVRFFASGSGRGRFTELQIEFSELAGPNTATGSPSIILPTSAGVASAEHSASGSPSIILPTASGTAKIIKKSTGAASLALITAVGVASIVFPASGTPEIILPTSAGVAEIIKTATGSPSIILPTAAGVAGVERNASGSPSIFLPTSAGTADADAGAGPDETATGAPSIILPTAAGVAEIIKPASGSPEILLPVAAGVAEIIKTASGSPSIILPTAAGVADAGGVPTAKDTSVRVTFGTPAVVPATGAGLQRFRMNLRRDAAHVGGSGIPTVDVFLYEDGVQRGAALVSGVAITSDSGQVVEALWDAGDLVTASDGSAVECFIQATANGAGADRRAVEVGAIEWCTIAAGDFFANGAPSIILPTAAGVATVTGDADQVHPPGTSRKRVDVRRLLDEDELLFVIIMAFLQIKDD